MDNNRRESGRSTAMPLLVLAVAVSAALLFALISTIGVVGVILLGGVLGSLAVVVLTVLRRRPVSLD